MANTKPHLLHCLRNLTTSAENKFMVQVLTHKAQRPNKFSLHPTHSFHGMSGDSPSPDPLQAFPTGKQQRPDTGAAVSGSNYWQSTTVRHNPDSYIPSGETATSSLCPLPYTDRGLGGLLLETVGPKKEYMSWNISFWTFSFTNCIFFFTILQVALAILLTNPVH